MWPVADLIHTRRLALEPLHAGHAAEMAAVLSDPELYTFVGGEPPSEATLERRYAVQSVGHSPDNSTGWVNWIARESRSDQAVGYVQATVLRGDDEVVAEVAWVVGAEFQSAGFATEAAAGMLRWLALHGVDRFAAYIHPDHHASSAVALKLGFAPTAVVVDDEVRWEALGTGDQVSPPRRSGHGFGRS
jgi:RimJ/RimL family protein N-acetyltransferase